MEHALECGCDQLTDRLIDVVVTGLGGDVETVGGTTVVRLEARGATLLEAAMTALDDLRSVGIRVRWLAPASETRRGTSGLPVPSDGNVRHGHARVPEGASRSTGSH